MRRARVSIECDVERMSAKVDRSQISRSHAVLKRRLIAIEDVDDTRALRALIVQVSSNRHAASRVMSELLPVRAELKADVVRLDRIMDEEASLLVNDPSKMSNTSNAAERSARVRSALRGHHRLLSEVKEDLVLVEGVVSHAKHVLEQCRFAYEEASRALASIQLDHKVIQGT